MGVTARPSPRPRLHQAHQPGGKVAADHVAVAGVAGPAGDQAGQQRRFGPLRAQPPEGVLHVEQAQIIFPALADDDAPPALLGVGHQAARLLFELALQILGVGRDPHRSQLRRAHSQAGAR
jgi:hypothetical protein